MDRRAIFFLGAATISAALIAETDAEVRWVPTALAMVYVVLALVSYLDWRSNNR
jgi:hypothetical protein